MSVSGAYSETGPKVSLALGFWQIELPVLPSSVAVLWLGALLPHLHPLSPLQACPGEAAELPSLSTLGSVYTFVLFKNPPQQISAMLAGLPGPIPMEALFLSVTRVGRLE